ncbi:MAG TPA: choice-of-anchor D domain-containing protein, partial [Terriglobales bacterium]|nr:choice-of-anchor D domain-containing protein [Terriglobales bacterium]
TVVVGNSGYESGTISNRGTVAVTIVSANVTNPEFSIVRPSFPLSIRPGGSTEIVVRFTPQSAGSPSAVVAIGAANQSTTIALKGEAILAGKFSASPASVSFGRVLKGKTQTRRETFTNSGSTNITVTQAAVSNPAFQVTGPSLPLVLAPSQSAVFNVTFAPTSTGTISASLSVSSSSSLTASSRSASSRVRHHGASESSSTIPLSGTCDAQAQLAVSPANLSFGTAQVGSSMTKTVALSNSGSTALQISQATVAGAGFRISGMNVPMTLQAGQSANISVLFSPSAAGNQSGSLTIVTDGANPVTLVSLSGNSPVPASGTLSANLASLLFGSIQVGATKTQSGILTNSGSSAVTISQANVSGGSFKGTGLMLPVKLTPGQSTAFTVSYTPTAAGTSSGNVSFVSDASNANLSVTLSGTATAAPAPGVLTSSLSSLNFGSVQVGKSKTQPEILTNTGDTAITLSRAALSGTAFTIGGLSLPTTLNPGQSASLTVTYAPTAAGNNTGAISLVSTASNPTVGIALTGAATAAPSLAVLAQSLSTLAFGNVQVGTTKTEPETLTNTGASPLTITQANISGSGFSIAGLSLPLSLGSGQSANFNVTYAPSSAGVSSGSLVISSDASNPVLAASLSATAVAAPNPGVLNASASSLSFGSVPVGNTKSQPELVRNTGGSAVTISQANLTGVGFSLEGIYLPLKIEAGESFTFLVVFAPGATANTSGTLSLVSDASNIVPAISLSGSGAAAGQLLVTPASQGFGSVPMGSNKSLLTTLTASNASVTISSGELSDPEFTLGGTSFPLTLAAGQSVTLSLIFTPQSTGNASGSLSLATNTSTATVTQALVGTGGAALQHSVDLSWDGSATGYFVYRGTKTGGPYAKLTASTTGSTSFNDTSVQAGTSYFYVTTSVDGSGTESDFSNEVKATVPTP